MIKIIVNYKLFAKNVLKSVKIYHTGDFPRGVGHRVENGRGLTKVAVVLLNGLIW